MDFIKNVLIFLVLICALSCNENPSSVTMEVGYQRISGETMGTTYNISYFDSLGRNFKSEVDSLLIVLDNELSTYNKNSFITKVNQTPGAVSLLDPSGKSLAPHFVINFNRSKEIFEKTNGNFDPTVMPLVNYWGFGYKERTLSKVDSTKVDSMIQNVVGFDKIELVENTIRKKSTGVEIDFSAIGKGYGVDAVGELLRSLEVENFMVEIGGELVANGKNDKGKLWSVGINTPKEDAELGDFKAIVELNNLALATSGNYRNYYTVDSLKFSHTINPSTGFSERNSLLSASIFASDCTTADALATASMVMGLPACAEMIERMPDIEGYFIYGSDEGNMEVIMTTGTPDILRK